MESGSASHRLCSLREDVLVEIDGPSDEIHLGTLWGDITISDPSPAVRKAIERMSMGPVRLDNVVPPDGAERFRVERILEQIGGCVVNSLGHDDTAGTLLSAVPIARRARFSLPIIQPHRPVRMSRFAMLRAAESGELVLESPLTRHRVVLHRPLAAQVVTFLSRPVLISDIALSMEMDLDLATQITSYLAATGMVLVGTGEPARARFTEDNDPVLAAWTPHELLFHSRSRVGRHDSPLGTMPVELQRVKMAPPLKPVPEGPKFQLYRPELAETSLFDPPFTVVMETNRHVRDFSGGEPTADQIGELLYRAARVRSTKEVSEQDLSYVVTDRPYPSVANRYELDLYLTVDRCDGLARGIYHYDPQHHVLTLINKSEAELVELLELAMIAAGSIERPPVLITMTARMARFACIYGGIAYSTVLEHVGILQQTLHLVATAMGLAPCALAFGDSEIANDAFLIDWPAEVSVGELALGLQPTERLSTSQSAHEACFTNAKRSFTVTDKLLY